MSNNTIPGIIQTQTISVTPQLASRWLSRNTHNRKIRENTVMRYTSDMAAGRWKYAADPIRFDINGMLIDGQHRLSAIMRQPEGFSLPMLVVSGLEPGSQEVMDQGSRRTAGDQLELRDVKNANQIAAIARLAVIWDSGLWFRDAHSANVLATSTAIQSWVAENAECVAWLQKNMASIRSNDAMPSVSGFVAVLFWRVSPARAEGFFYALKEGAGAGHPINTLDKRLQKMRREGVKWSSRDVVALFIQAWNAWVSHKSPKAFPRPSGGWKPETYPRVKKAA